jgi:hypothetical protein
MKKRTCSFSNANLYNLSRLILRSRNGLTSAAARGKRSLPPPRRHLHRFHDLSELDPLRLFASAPAAKSSGRHDAKRNKAFRELGNFQPSYFYRLLFKASSAGGGGSKFSLRQLARSVRPRPPLDFPGPLEAPAISNGRFLFCSTIEFSRACRYSRGAPLRSLSFTRPTERFYARASFTPFPFTHTGLQLNNENCKNK